MQFTPKYRRDAFRDGAVKRACEESFLETARQLGLVIHALAFGPDHVHFVPLLFFLILLGHFP
jgi:REP element-mobilizing transposase RayT